MSSRDPDDAYDLTDDSVAVSEKPMGFFDHLDELRGTLVKCAIAFVVFAVLITFYIKEVNDVLMWPLNYVHEQNPKFIVDLSTNAPMDGFSVILQMCTLGGLALAAPFMFFFLGQFVAPALSKKELRAVLPVIICALVLFLIGASFSFFFLVPSTLRVSAEINEMLNYSMRWTPNSYYSLLMWLVLGVGGSFEFPLLIVLLVYMGILKVAMLRKYRRHAIVVIFILAAVVTPTPDPITQTMFAAPLYILFELAVIAGARVEAARNRRLLENE